MDHDADEARREWVDEPVGLDLGGVQTKLDTLGLGIGEHIRQGPQPQAQMFRDRTSTLGQEPAHLSDRRSGGGTVGTGQQSEDGMREIVPQVGQRDDQPVDEQQPMPGTGPRLTFPGPAASLATVALDYGLSRVGQLPYQASQMPPTDPCEQLKRENATVDHDQHRMAPPT